MYSKPGTNCSIEHVDSGAKAWVAEQVPVSAFVEGTTDDEPRSGGMVARHVDGADGSRMLVTVFAKSGASECDFNIAPGRCVPSRQAPIALYSDAACTKAVVAAAGGTKPEVGMRVVQGAKQCVTGYEFFEVGAQVGASEDLYANRSGSCESITNPLGTYYHLGAPVAVTSFPEVTTRKEGTGPVQALRRVDAGGKALGPAHAFWQEDENLECSPGHLSDSLICVPSDSGVSGRYFDWFSNSTCSGENLRFGSFDACQATPGDYMVSLGASCLPPIQEFQSVHARGGSVPTPVYQRSGTGCQFGAYPTGQTHYLLGAEASASAFPELTLKTDE